jgi:hypothetical protein
MVLRRGLLDHFSLFIAPNLRVLEGSWTGEQPFFRERPLVYDVENAKHRGPTATTE